LPGGGSRPACWTREVEHLLLLEFDGRDDWLGYLVLIAWSEIELLLQTRGPDA
jgi:hypothetical protein